VTDPLSEKAKKKEKIIVPWWVSSDERRFHAVGLELDHLTFFSAPIMVSQSSILGTCFLGVTSSVHVSSSLLGLQEPWKSAHQLASCLQLHKSEHTDCKQWPTV